MALVVDPPEAFWPPALMGPVVVVAPTRPFALSTDVLTTPLDLAAVSLRAAATVAAPEVEPVPGAMIYAHHTDLVTPNATLSVSSGTAATGYPASNLGDLNPAKPAKLTGTSGAWLADFGTAQRVDWVALIGHNLDAGAVVQVQANAADTWGAPSLDVALAIPAADEDGFAVNPWVDLTDATGYTTGGYRYWRLQIVSGTSSPVAVGEWALNARKRTLDPNIRWGLVQSERLPTVELETEFGVKTIAALRAKTRRITGELILRSATRAAVNTWWRDAWGRARPFCVVLEPGVNEALMVRFGAVEKAITRVFTTRSTMPVEFEELSRGKPL
jgi:hypothetical protein